MSLYLSRRIAHHQIRTIVHQKRNIYKPSFFETFRNAIATPAQPMSTSATRKADGNNGHQTYFQPGDSASPKARPVGPPSHFVPPTQVIVVPQGNANDPSGSHSSGGWKQGRGVGWNLGLISVSFVLGGLISLFVINEQFKKYIVKQAQGKIPGAQPAEVEAAKIWLIKAGMHAELLGNSESVEGSSAEPILQAEANPFARAYEDAKKHSQALLLENLKLSMDNESLEEDVGTQETAITSLHGALLDLVICASHQQSGNQGTTNKAAIGMTPIVVRDDSILANIPLKIQDTPVELPPTRCSLLRIVDPQSGKNRAIILGVDIRGIESQLLTRPDMEEFDRLMHISSEIMSQMFQLGEDLHELDENVSADMPILVWEPRFVTTTTLNSPKTRRTFIARNNFPPGFPMKQLRGIPDVRESTTGSVSNAASPALANRRILHSLKGRQATEDQDSKETKGEKRDSK